MDNTTVEYLQQTWNHEKSLVQKKQIVEVPSFTDDILERLDADRESIFHSKLGGIPVYLFRDHDSSYNVWAYRDLKSPGSLLDLSIIHIDTHADLPWNQNVEKFGKPATKDTALKKLAGFSTFLIPAIVDGYVGRIYWLGSRCDTRQQFIIPSTQTYPPTAKVDVKQAEPVERHYPYWTTSNHEDLISRLRPSKAELNNGYSLDIDIDYFLDGTYLGVEEAEAKFNDRLTRTMQMLRKISREFGKPECVTIAFSPAFCSHKEWANRVLNKLIQTIGTL